MPDNPTIKQITLPSGTTYDIKDQGARDMIDALSGFTVFLGVTTTALTDGSTTNPIKINNVDVTATTGGIATYQSKEFIWNGTAWQEFGDLSGLGSLAFKNSASGSFTPSGSVSQPTFSGTSFNSTGNFTPSGSVTISTGTGTANYTPAGTVTQPTFNGSNYTPEGSVTISTGTGTANYTPAGTVGTPTITVTPSTTTKYVAANATGGGSVTAGTAASCTLPILTTSVSNENLTIGWTSGSFTANTPTAVTLPSFSSQTIATGISSATSTQPSFTGTGVQLKGSFSGTAKAVAGTVTQPTFSGTGVELKGSFSGTQGTITVSGTATGTVSKPTFTGTAGTVTVS